MNSNTAMKMLNGPDILVIGDSMLDIYTSGIVSRKSPESDAPVLSDTTTRIMPGGAANVACDLASRGARVLLLTSIGGDRHGEMLIDALNRRMVGVWNQGGDNGTTVKHRFIAGGRQIIRHDEDVISDGVRVGSLSGFKLVVVSDYAKGAIQQPLLDDLRKSSATVIADPKPASRLDWSGLTCLTPNRKEAFEMLGQECDHGESVKAARELHRASKELKSKLNLENLVVTLGERGMLALIGDSIPFHVHIPSVGDGVLDVTGAGDIAISSMAFSVATGKGWLEAAQQACIDATESVHKQGTGNG